MLIDEMEAEFETMKQKKEKGVTQFAETVKAQVDKEMVDDKDKTAGLTKEELEEAERLIDPEGAQAQAVASVSKKGIWRDIKKVCQQCDVIMYVLDARDPKGSRCAEVEELLEEHGKKVIYVINKVDLVPSENAEAWKAALKEEGHNVVVFQANLMTRKMETEEEQVSPAMQAQQKNVERLMKALFKYYLKFAEKKELESISVGVVGYTNSGKSSIINCLRNKIVCPTSSQQFLTKKLQEVKLNSQIYLVDCPGVVLS